MRREVLEYRSRLKEWHGEPMYTIRRAFIILGTLQVKLLDPEDLYSSDDLEDDDDDSDDDSLLRCVHRLNRGTKRPHPGPVDGDNAGPRGSVHGNLDDGVCPGDPQTSPKDGQECLGGSAKRLKRGCRPVDETALACRDLASHDHLLAPHRTLARRWKLGPDMTTEDAIRIRPHFMAPA
ncbi:hypothetical protein N7535_003891 [Penicillium sp. DV-2018c]|nr:hypothetical protein N7535_003891 [Penicillium sp. DV-2018c]